MGPSGAVRGVVDTPGAAGCPRVLATEAVDPGGLAARSLRCERRVRVGHVGAGHAGDDVEL
jgi:hypothetical protein